VSFEIDLSDTLKRGFDRYIGVALEFLGKGGIDIIEKEDKISLEEIIVEFRRL